MRRKKMTSRRFLASVWAMLTSTGLMITAIVTGYDGAWIGVTLPLLISIVLLWIGAESYTKTHPVQREERSEE